MSTQPTAGGNEQTHHEAHDESHSSHVAESAASDVDEIEGLKMLMLDSAELATRSANLAVGSAENMKKATHNLVDLMKVNKKQHLIMLGIAGGLMFVTAIVFATSIFTLKSRINQMDAMLASLSKRVVELNDSMEMVGSVNEALQEMVGKQQGIADAQSKLEARIGESIKSSQGVPEETAKQLDAKNQILAKQVQSLDGRLQAQANAIKAMSNIMQNVQGSLTDTNGLKREMEALARIQKDRQTAESLAIAQANAAATQAAQKAAQEAASAARQKERMVQYPRSQAADAAGAGVLTVKP